MQNPLCADPIYLRVSVLLVLCSQRYTIYRKGTRGIPFKARETLGIRNSQRLANAYICTSTLSDIYLVAGPLNIIPARPRKKDNSLAAHDPPNVSRETATLWHRRSMVHDGHAFIACRLPSVNRERRRDGNGGLK